MCRSHHLVHCSPCLQTRHLDETNRFGCVSLRLWFVLLGCVWCVLWAVWPSACCSCWHWLCRGRAGELALAGLAAGGCGRAPRSLARCSPCNLASPIANLEHAPARAAICSAHLHRHRGLVPWPAVQWAFAAAAAGDVGGGRGRWQQRPAGQQPNCTWRWHSAINSALSVRFGLLFMGRVDEHDACICEISPEVEVVQAHTPREEDMHERQRGPVGLKTCSFVPVNRMLRYTGAAMRQLWSTRMAKHSYGEV